MSLVDGLTGNVVILAYVSWYLWEYIGVWYSREALTRPMICVSSILVDNTKLFSKVVVPIYSH